ncbi:hypothetical protein D3C87_1902770 [compost metagenome]
MNKLTLAVGGKPEPEKPAAKQPQPPKSAGQSHIRQARNGGKPNLPTSGPMAEMLKKMFGGKEN